MYMCMHPHLYLYTDAFFYATPNIFPRASWYASVSASRHRKSVGRSDISYGSDPPRLREMRCMLSASSWLAVIRELHQNDKGPHTIPLYELPVIYLGC